MANKKKGKLLKALVRSPTPPPIADDDDSDLMNQLLNQLDSQEAPPTVQAETAALLNEMDLNKQADMLESQPKARRAAALAETYSPDDPVVQARLEKQAKDEEEAIARICKKLGVGMYEINPDGHCLFSAVADQLALLGLLPPEQARYEFTRAAAANYIYTHPDDFLPFLPSTEGEDGYGADSAGLMSPKQFEQYCKSIQNTAVWGGEPEILALSRAFNVPIHVIQSAQPEIVVHNPSEHPIAPPVRISYHRRMYGLGEHYNSLRPVKAV